MTIICDDENREQAEAVAEVVVACGGWPVIMNNETQVSRGLQDTLFPMAPPKNLHDAIKIAEDSELLAETLGEHVYEFFLRNKRAEWEEYRGQVSAFERDRMLPVI